MIESTRIDEEEISHHEDIGTVGPTEAFWRMYECDLHTRFPAVVSLVIHLEEEQTIF